jgi:hypothetical protein
MPSSPISSMSDARHGRFHATRCSDGIIILDIEGDAYWSLYTPRSLESSAENGTGLDRLLVERALHDAGLASATDGFPHIPAAMATPRWRDLPNPAASRPPVRVVLAFVLAVLRAGLLARTCSFAGLIRAVQRSRAIPPAGPEHQLATLVGWFDRLSLWLPVRPLCLVRSLMLLLFLQGRGIGAQWIFGATLFPFQAHCWLAVGDLLVGERTDRVEAFSIVFATGRNPA